MIDCHSRKGSPPIWWLMRVIEVASGEMLKSSPPIWWFVRAAVVAGGEMLKRFTTDLVVYADYRGRRW